MSRIKQFALFMAPLFLLLSGCIEQPETAISLGSDYVSGVRINKKSNQISPTQVTPILFEVIFDEEIDTQTFTVDDIKNLGSARVLQWQIEPSDDNRTYVLKAVSVDALGGTVMPSMEVGAVKMKNSRRVSESSSSQDNFVLYDIIKPEAPANVTLLPQAASPDRSSKPLAHRMQWASNLSEAVTYEAQIVAVFDDSIVQSWTLLTSGERPETQNLLWDKTYKYRVRAVDEAGNVSAWTESPFWHTEGGSLHELEPIFRLYAPEYSYSLSISHCATDRQFVAIMNDAIIVFEDNGNGWVQVVAFPAEAAPGDYCVVHGSRFFITNFYNKKVLVLEKLADGYKFTSEVTVSKSWYGFEILPFNSDELAVETASFYIFEVVFFKLSTDGPTPQWNLVQEITTDIPHGFTPHKMAYARGQVHLAVGGIETPALYSYGQSPQGTWELVSQTPLLNLLSYSNHNPGVNDLIAIADDLYVHTNLEVGRYIYENEQWVHDLSISHNDSYTFLGGLIYDDGYLLMSEGGRLNLNRFNADKSQLNLVATLFPSENLNFDLVGNIISVSYKNRHIGIQTGSSRLFILNQSSDP